MYHPDDGIVAYEHVLKTLLILSENLDNDIQQQIISMIPLPKGISNDKIRNVIYKTVELTKAANNMSTCQKITEDKCNTEILKEISEVQLNQNVLADTSKNFELSKQFVPPVPEVFKGFPPNEISTVHSHVRSVNYMYDTVNYNIPYINPYINVAQNFSSNTNEQEELLKLHSKLKWFHSPHLLYKINPCQITASNYQQGLLQPVNDKYFQLSTHRINNWNQYNVSNIPHALHQDTTCLRKKLCKNSIIPNELNKNGILNFEVTHCDQSSLKTKVNEIFHNDDMHQNLKKYNLNKNRNFNMKMQEDFGQELKNEQQAIQQDIYKMDVVYYDEERKNTIINMQLEKEDNFIMDNFMVRKKLKTSLQNFLKRAEQEIFIEFPLLPHTKSLHVISPSSKCEKFANKRNLENNNHLDVSKNNMNNFKDISTSGNIKKSVEKKSSASLHVFPKSAQLQVFHKKLNTAVNKTQIIECEKEDNTKNLLYKSSTKQTKQKSLNTSQQTVCVTELATFKKQYYDTLLNIQKAKMAVANSLAISSVESFTKYDPCYYNHSYQQQHGPLTVTPHFTTAQSRYSNIHNNPYTWVKYNNWRHPTMKPLRFPQHVRYN
ncbi:hypothetical protein WH47_02743 [Habropoda laboriosa]|uniref:Uncharacterized protein n=1 Tax=Habropoda laboriosa TaxID=597456 RepID=A0A0L7QXG9_9HYME|nr:hypothetical protein WH47_02743 [Habropoda laboriosa]